MNRRTLATLAWLAAGASSSGAAAPGASIEVGAARITVHLVEVSPGDAVERIAEIAGATVTGRAIARAPLTVTFEAPTWQDVLARLLDGQAYTATYTRSGHLKRLALVDSPSPKAGAPSRPTLPPSDAPEAAGLYAIATTAWSAPTPRARAAAVIELAQAIEARPLAAAVALPTLRAIGADQIATGMRWILGRRARRTLRRIVRRTRVPAIADTASAVLEQLGR